MGKPKADPSRSAYTDEERDEIIAHVLVSVSTGRFVSRVFREDETTDTGVALPAVSTFWKWVYEDDKLPATAMKPGEAVSQGLSDKLVRARAAGIEALLDETLEIADDGRNDTYFKELDSGKEIEVTDTDVIQRSRLRVDTRMKLAMMLKPKTYGPKLDLTSDGEKIGLTEAINAAKERQRQRIANGEE